MIEFIKQITAKEQPALEELLACFEKLRQISDVCVIKMDGARAAAPYTVFVIPLSKGSEAPIRSDKNDLMEAMVTVLKKYVSDHE
jgi:hypothetical protein